MHAWVTTSNRCAPCFTGLKPDISGCAAHWPVGCTPNSSVVPRVMLTFVLAGCHTLPSQQPAWLTCTAVSVHMSDGSVTGTAGGSGLVVMSMRSTVYTLPSDSTACRHMCPHTQTLGYNSSGWFQKKSAACYHVQNQAHTLACKHCRLDIH